MHCKHISPQQSFNKVQQFQASIIFSLTGKIIIMTMAFRLYQIDSVAASVAETAQALDTADLTVLVSNRRLFLRGWRSKYRFCGSQNRGSERRECHMSHISALHR